MPRSRTALAPSLRRLGTAVFIVVVLALPAAAECVDLNTASLAELRQIIHIDEKRAPKIIAKRPWRSVHDLTDISGIAERRLADILEQGLACVDGDTGQLATAPAGAECVDINAAALEELVRIVHLDETRAAEIVAGRPWPDVRALTQVRNIGPMRLAEIKEQGLACVGHEVPAGEREVIRGRAVVLDGDTFEVAGERVRLIGIDAPEVEQACRLDGLDWPCGQVATAAMFELVGGADVTCEVYGRDRFERALAVCRRAADGLALNREIVRLGHALAWYPERGAILGPDYSDAEAEARAAGRGMWRGEFVGPWEWRRRGR